MIADAQARVGVTWPDRGVRGGIADAIAIMDRCDIARACISARRFPWGALGLGNEVTAAARAYLDRLSGIVIASPCPVALPRAECDRYLSGPGFGGIRAHRLHTSLECDHPAHAPIHAEAAEYRVSPRACTSSPAVVEQLLSEAQNHPPTREGYLCSDRYAATGCL